MSNNSASPAAVAEKVETPDVCCVCMEEDEFSTTLSYSCGTCSEGYVCDFCTDKIDPETTNVIKCPCCRTFNWKYCYRMLFYLLDQPDEDDDDDSVLSPAHALFLKNRLIY